MAKRRKIAKRRNKNARYLTMSSGGRSKTVSIAKAPWDMGAQGQANQHNLVTEERGEVDEKTGKLKNPNGVKGRRRVDMLDKWYKSGKISRQSLVAGKMILTAFEETMRGPGWPDTEKVQSSPKPDAAIAFQIDHISKFHDVSKHIPKEDREIIDTCVLKQLTPESIRKYTGHGYQTGLKHLDMALSGVYNKMLGS